LLPGKHGKLGFFKDFFLIPGKIRKILMKFYWSSGNFFKESSL